LIGCFAPVHAVGMTPLAAPALGEELGLKIKFYAGDESFSDLL
jgi:hypothetical protein